MISKHRLQERLRETSDPSPAEGEPFIQSFDSAHVAPPPTRPWYRRPPPVWVVDSADFKDDDPDELRRAPIAETASAFLALAHDARHSPRRCVREAAALLRHWLEEDQGRRLDLAVRVGLKRSGASLADLDARSEIGVLILELARRSPWATMAASTAADDLRTRFARWEGVSWPRVSHHAKPPETLDEVGRVFFQIKRFGLHHSLPNEATLARMIEADRARSI
jgi:hypothetical protein